MQLRIRILRLQGKKNLTAAYPEDLLNRVHALSEHVHAQLLKASSRDAGVEVDALKQAVNLNGGL